MSDNEDVGSEPTCFIISPGLKAPPPTKDAPPSDSPDVGSAVLQLKQFAEVRRLQQVQAQHSRHSSCSDALHDRCGTCCRDPSLSLGP
jgi:hypothetical protein